MRWDSVRTVALDDVDLAYRTAGSGEELIVLLHGWPQTGLCWRKLVGPLAERYTVVVPDLRGYGASGLADTGYDKRATAADLSALVRHLGHDSAVVVGHDRGARVAHRWALDRPSEVGALALLDVLPTRVVMNSFDRTSAAAMWHWFFHLQPELPELLLAGNVEPYLRYFLRRVLASGAVDEETFRHYVAEYTDPAHLQATLEDYRAGFTTDLELDEADHARGLRLRCPLLLLWGAEGGLAQDDVLAVWREHHADPAAVSGHAVPGGHYVPEEAPDQVLDALAGFLGGRPNR
ncbi:alpha/beta hydrolase [Streptomyces luomodiensis]|uniref:Alpha/beta hydrolase n=1 Tax=Streptomyces luomodiensis TaxID=3026192 RepID=A0ABY9UPD3_9ACTN|nr:alpha/beta hydrolase [Streptomyces sp. SCA4-21]WNE94399.1 alpha/beta hydrolase [Streptomyces sp. SCA4-21]